MSGEGYLERKEKGENGMFTVAMIGQLNFFYFFYSILALHIHVLHLFHSLLHSWAGSIPLGKDSLDRVASRPKREEKSLSVQL